MACWNIHTIYGWFSNETSIYTASPSWKACVSPLNGSLWNGPWKLDAKNECRVWVRSINQGSMPICFMVNSTFSHMFHAEIPIFLRGLMVQLALKLLKLTIFPTFPPHSPHFFSWWTPPVWSPSFRAVQDFLRGETLRLATRLALSAALGSAQLPAKLEMQAAEASFEWSCNPDIDMIYNPMMIQIIDIDMILWSFMILDIDMILWSYAYPFWISWSIL